MDSRECTELDELFRHAEAGDEQALAALYMRYRDRLRRMVELRLDDRLRGRIDPSDVLQEAYMEVSKRFARYAESRSVPLFLWLRLVAGQKLVDLHRAHLGSKMRDARQEISLSQPKMPAVSSSSLAAQLMGSISTPSKAAAREELRLRVQDALNCMDMLDREVLSLRHFEQLSNSEVALVLNVSPSAASNRYVRAIKRLKELLAEILGPWPSMDD